MNLTLEHAPTLVQAAAQLIYGTLDVETISLNRADFGLLFLYKAEPLLPPQEQFWMEDFLLEFEQEINRQRRLVYGESESTNPHNEMPMEHARTWRQTWPL